MAVAVEGICAFIYRQKTGSFDCYNGVFPKCRTEFAEFSDKNICHYSKRARTYRIATSCVRDQDATKAPATHT